jgi:hypothetical protein
MREFDHWMIIKIAGFRGGVQEALFRRTTPRDGVASR